MPAEEKSTNEGSYIPDTRKPPLTLHEAAAKGGSAKSQVKREASLRNLAKAQAVRAEKQKALGRGLAWIHQKPPGSFSK